MNHLTQALGRFDAYFRSTNGVPPNDRISVPTAEWVALRALLGEALSAQAAPQAVQAAVPVDMRLVPEEFVRGFSDLAHNYSLQAEAPDYYHGVERDAFRDAYERCGRDLAKVRAMLAAAPAHPAEGVPAQVLTVDALAEQLRSIGVYGGNAEKLMPFLSEYLAATHPTQQVLDARTAYEAECFRWLRDEALKVWKKGPVVFMTDADGCPGDGGAWSDNILSGKKLERAIPVAAQAKQGAQP